MLASSEITQCVRPASYQRRPCGFDAVALGLLDTHSVTHVSIVRVTNYRA